MPVLNQIVEWSTSRPLWQRDALRRLVLQPNLVVQDYIDLLRLCKEQRGIVAEGATPLTPVPITLDDIPGDGAAGTPVVLTSIHDLENVNAIVTGQTLNIGNTGLTVVYGDNASGKTGYVRILKQSCRARGSIEPVLHNVFGDRPNVPSHAIIDYNFSGGSNSYRWEPEAAKPSELHDISIFDEASSVAYVDEDCEVAYLPFGLDLLPRLAGVCREIGGRLKDEIKQLEQPVYTLPGISEGTTAHGLLQQLEQPDITERISHFALFNATEETRLLTLQTLLARLAAESPERRAAELLAKANRFQIMRQNCQKLATLLSDEHIEQLRIALLTKNTNDEAARVAITMAFSSAPLPGVGTDVWKAMWEAARLYYNTTAYPGYTFPPTRENELCVLCMQPLQNDSLTRARRFEDFIQSATQTIADGSKREVEAIKQKLIATTLLPFLDQNTYNEILSIDGGIANNLVALQNALIIRNQIVSTVVNPQDIINLQALPHTEFNGLEDLEERLRAEAKSLQSAVEPEENTRLKSEYNELVSKKLIAGNRVQILLYVQRCISKKLLSTCLPDIDTTGVTRKNTELTESAVIESLATVFLSQLRDFHLQHIAATITTSGGERGTAYHRIRIPTREQVAASSILSKGEHRAVALASFFTELQLQTSNSTIIFDDPVSSLDHDRRRLVAEKIVEVARSRPVLLFTHDIMFSYYLRKSADSLGVSINQQYLSRIGNNVGKVNAGWPWGGKNTRERIGELRNTLQTIIAIFNQGNSTDYESKGKELYGKLREAWERAVEEKLLNGAISRFDMAVQTLKLRRLSGLAPELITRLEAGMKKSSRWLTGHDTPGAAQEPVPGPAEIKSDIDEFENWVSVVNRHYNP